MGLSTAATDLADLVLARRCLGCGRPGRALCGACLARERGPAVPVEVMTVVAVAAAPYAGLARTAILEYKEHGNRALAPALGTLLADAVIEQLAASGHSVVALVPVPGHRRAPRGFDALGSVVRHARADLRQRGIEARSWRPIRSGAAYQPLKGLDRQARRGRIEGAFRPVWRAVRSAPRGAVLLVDDVITTGATATEALRVLERMGIRVDGVAAIAAVSRGRQARIRAPAPAMRRP